ncbi:hypothetical protein VTN77DRAFT_9108 [Rasamsonia byssochlamydoides]|uniref:uncharacterized protein n=1 Tax=Rasamsonia byssochlamydoides TaxID=89139 RepID=UPI00374261AE
MIVERTVEDNGVHDRYHDQSRLDQGSLHGSHHHQALERRGPTPHAGPKSVVNWSATPVPPSSYGRRELCEEAVCRIRDLERKCELTDRASKDARKACQMCYPRKDTKLVNAHCTARRRQEVRAFYFVCIFFIVASLGAGIAIFLRNRNRRRRSRRSIINHKQKSKDAAALPSESDRSGLSTQVPWLGNRRHDGQAEEHRNPWDDANSNSIEKKNWTVQQRWQQKLGLFSRSGPRKRIQDLFDLESLKSPRKDAGHPKEVGAERIPVLPRAPNASLRLSRINSKGCLRQHYSSRENVNDPETIARQPTPTLPEIRVQQVNSPEKLSFS